MTLLRRLYETLGREELKEVLRVLNIPGCIDTWVLLLENPKAVWRATDIAKELKVSDATVYRAVSELKNVGLIKVQATVQDKKGPPIKLWRYKI